MEFHRCLPFGSEFCGRAGDPEIFEQFGFEELLDRICLSTASEASKMHYRSGLARVGVEVVVYLNDPFFGGGSGSLACGDVEEGEDAVESILHV